MPRPLKPPNPYASWSALFGATVQKLRLSLRSRPVVTQEELGKLVHAAGSTVSAIERGILRPSASFVEKCEEVLPAGGMLRAMFRFVSDEWDDWERLGGMPPTASIPAPAEVAASPMQLSNPSFLEALSDDAMEATELARQAEASSIGAGTLESLDRAIDRLARDYPSTPPALLEIRVKRRLREVAHLLGGRTTVAQLRHLLVAGGWLATLLAVLQFDLGDQDAAERTRDAAFQLGKEGEHQEIMAWTFELLAWFALVSGRLSEAIDHARAGFQLAPHTSAGVQLAVQEARVWSRLGNQREAEDALRRGGAALAKLPVASHPEHHFTFDPTKLSFYAATCYALLGVADRAEEHARDVIAHAINGDGTVRWPTRLAVARVDLGLVAAKRSQLDEAAHFGIEALDSGRVVASTLGWFAALDAALQRDGSDVAEVQDFHERYLLTRRSMTNTAAGS
jgi:tetratricopeptide (TPR) repeat protein/DNA-binding XRE family transcriptional regulator